MSNQQRLFWALSLPGRYLGLSVDEWIVSAPLVGCGIIVLQGGEGLFGLGLMAVGIGLCGIFKKWKTLSANFLLKSFLVGEGVINAPQGHPNLVGQVSGK